MEKPEVHEKESNLNLISIALKIIHEKQIKALLGIKFFVVHQHIVNFSLNFSSQPQKQSEIFIVSHLSFSKKKKKTVVQHSKTIRSSTYGSVKKIIQ